jgi:hypothetical protein
MGFGWSLLVMGLSDALAIHVFTDKFHQEM